MSMWKVSSLIAFLFSVVASLSAAVPTFAIAVHGGAGSSPKKFTAEQNKARHEGVAEALRVGKGILEKGGSALDAVEATVRVLENNPLFNAGKGAVLNAEGKAELDASIMDGATKNCGAVAGATIAKNPIILARAVMTKTRHVLLAGDGADVFAKEVEVETVKPDYFITTHQKARWEKAKAKKTSGASESDLSERMGTVGCVAMDSKGNLAAATSTGGLQMKKFGRVGDSPIIGAGTYANNKTCAVSCTGVGEEYIRNVIAYDVHARMKYEKVDLEKAVKTELQDVLKPGHGGIIAVDFEGKIVMEFNTGGMACGAADSEGRFEVNWPME